MPSSSVGGMSRLLPRCYFSVNRGSRDSPSQTSAASMLIGMPAPRVVLVHGAATTAAVWSPVRGVLLRELPAILPTGPQRAYSGELDNGVPARASMTVGALSPPARHEAARALSSFAGLPYRVLDGCGHAAHLERPGLFAAVIGGVVGAVGV